MIQRSAWRWKQLAGPGIVLLAAVIAVGPLLVRGPSCGSDFGFHFGAWFDYQHSWRQGIVYPQWMASANHGAGEPRFVFYSPLTWMLGAATGLVFPWTFVPVALSFLLLAATGMATRALARQALSDGAATLAGCASIFFGYALYCIYNRSDFAEAAGGFWIPLLLLFALRECNTSASAALWRRSLDGSIIPLALVIAGCWLSNPPLGLMASYLLAVLAIVAALFSRSWLPLVRAFASAILGIGFSAFYLFPSAWEQRWVNIRHANEHPHNRIESWWLFGGHFNLSPKTLLASLHANAGLTKVSLLVVSMVGLALGSLLVSWLRGKLSLKDQLPANQSPQNRFPARGWWVPLALIPLAVLFFQLPISLPVWNLLPKLRFLRFPMRWLVTLEAPMAIFFALAVWPDRRNQRKYIVAASSLVFVAISVFSSGRFVFVECGGQNSEPHALEMVLSHGEGGRESAESREAIQGQAEFAYPAGARNDLIAIGLPDACLVSDSSLLLGKMAEFTQPVWYPEQGSCEATFAATSRLNEHLRFVANIPHPGFLVLRLRSYPAWRVRINGRQLSDMPKREDGLMVVPVPQGLVDLTVDWTTTPDVLAGRWLSTLAALLLVGLWLLERKQRRPRLS